MMDLLHQKILAEAASHLHALGSANDAEDHNYVEDARRMRIEACTALCELLEQHPFLGELLPSLREELDSGHILGFGWSMLLDSIETHLARLKVQR